jgi:predicted NUDIX family phosphoesterase
MSGSTMNVHKRDFIGGVLSKDEGEVKSSEDLFNAIQREIKEEINIDMANIQDIRLIGGILTDNFYVALVFSTILNLSSSELLSLFEKREDDELSRLIILPFSEFSKEADIIGGYRKLAVSLLK